MAITRALLLPVGTMLVTGACNTLLMKFLVRQAASPGPGLPPANFDYPFFQTLLMMLGELMCLVAFGLTYAGGGKAGGKTPPSGIMAIPVSCDWAATTLVNAAYVMIPASTIQMCRGCIVVFTCFLSVTVLKRRQRLFQYVGVALVALGISIVSLEAVLQGNHHAGVAHSTALVGIGLCLAGQIFQSSMLVIEEKFLSSYTVPPMQMVGLEGFFGCLIGCALLPALQISGVEKSTEALHMLQTDGWIQFGCVASMCSIALFNWSGVTVTQQASAVARSTIDVSRTSIIWMVELALRWNTFSWLQLSGFIVLVLGTMVYNGILRIPALGRMEEDPLLEEDSKA